MVQSNHSVDEEKIGTILSFHGHLDFRLFVAFTILQNQAVVLEDFFFLNQARQRCQNFQPTIFQLAFAKITCKNITIIIWYHQASS